MPASESGTDCKDGFGCVCANEAMVNAHSSEGKIDQDRKCYNNPQVRHTEEWHDHEREMCEMGEKTWCETN